MFIYTYQVSNYEYVRVTNMMNKINLIFFPALHYIQHSPKTQYHKLRSHSFRHYHNLDQMYKNRHQSLTLRLQ